jgi:hypothetical protein
MARATSTSSAKYQTADALRSCFASGPEIDLRLAAGQPWRIYRSSVGLIAEIAAKRSSASKNSIAAVARGRVLVRARAVVDHVKKMELCSVAC